MEGKTLVIDHERVAALPCIGRIAALLALEPNHSNGDSNSPEFKKDRIVPAPELNLV